MTFQTDNILIYQVFVSVLQKSTLTTKLQRMFQVHQCCNQFHSEYSVFNKTYNTSNESRQSSLG
jgi:hypothetical protein